jgi:hypothetical protein
MAWRRISCLASSALGLRLCSAPSEAAVTHTTAHLNLRARPAIRGQFNRTFVVGLAGATIASLGLFALSCAGSCAGGRIRDEGCAELKSTSDCVSGQQRIAGTFRSDIEAVAFNLPPIQFDNREPQGDTK